MGQGRYRAGEDYPAISKQFDRNTYYRTLGALFVRANQVIKVRGGGMEYLILAVILLVLLLWSGSIK